ncbi:DUF1572 family protein [Flavobacterium frigidarium]|jgi:hypothetical protein|uniref:DUF1572 family protein n=1 Tax=Flavobacterium frigidarium TaxID=99286 RepID=A0ABV4KG96_9FLAO|tara:strand:- start:7378 stop:7953 length:576 start_codon:yes stop_codon:yes gene_type:complete
MDVALSYLSSTKKQFAYYKLVGEKAIDQLEDEQLFIVANEDTNSIATIIKHIAGNMLSRWTDFLITDGEKDWRNRDTEFANDLKTKDEVLDIWNSGWNCLFATLDSLKSENLSQIIYIRNEGHTVVEAINRQLAHYPYHIGQIVFYSKLLKQSSWNSLTIPRNKSVNYNNTMFAEEKNIQNFTDKEIKRLE